MVWRAPKRLSAHSSCARGFFAVNRTGEAFTHTFQTELPPGDYCNVLATPCAPAAVDESGELTVTLAPMTAAAFHVGTLAPTAPAPAGTVDVVLSVKVDTEWGQRVVLVGDHPALGNGDPSAGIDLGARDYPVWRRTVRMPEGARVSYRFALIDGDGNVTVEAGPTRTVQAGEHDERPAPFRR